MRRAVKPMLNTPLRAGLLALACAWAAQAQATPGVDEPPVPGTPRPLVLPAFEEASLANGVRLIVAPRPGQPLVTAALHLRPGGVAEPAGRTGLSALTAELRSKGARRGGREVGATELAQQAEALGGLLASGSGWGGHTHSITVVRPNLDAAVALLADVVRQPLLQPAEFERLRAQTADALKLPLADPMQLASLAASRGAWGDSVYGGRTTPASLARISIDEVRDFHQRQSRPDMATLVLAGGITLAEGRALAERLLGDWRAPDRPALAASAAAPSPRTPATVLVNLPGAGQSGVVVTAPEVALDSPERRAAQLATAVLGGGYSTRLNAELRIRRGLTYGASAANELQPSGGVMRAAAQTKHASAAEVAQVSRDEILRLGREAPAEAELAARKAALVGGFGRSFDTTAGLAGVVLGQVERGRPLAELARTAPEIEAVTAEQVREHAARHWTPESLRTVIVGDLAAGGDALKALDPKALRLQAAELDLESPTLRR
jgi:zinc protease